jgi:ATP-dependent 26S proteasome regulatory subunit
MARPGRIDQAIEFPLPDADCRRQLIELYGKGLHLSPEVIADAVARTNGTSPAFIKELLRKAATYAADREEAQNANEGLCVTVEDIEAALREILFTGGKLTARLLGGTPRTTGFRQ